MSEIFFLYRSIELYIVAAHQNRLNEAILVDATMYSIIEKKKNITNLLDILFRFWGHGIHGRQNKLIYVIFIKLRNFKNFLQQSRRCVAGGESGQPDTFHFP